MPPVVWGGSSARQTFSPVVSTSMSCAQSSGVTMSCADSSRATPSHARYRARRQRTGERHRAVASRARASAAAPPPPLLAAAVHEPSGGPSSGRCAADADRGGSRSRCGSLRYAMTAFSYTGTLARPCRAPGATLWREKRLLQRQRDHIADIWPVKRKKNRCSVTAGLSLGVLTLPLEQLPSTLIFKLRTESVEALRAGMDQHMEVADVSDDDGGGGGRTPLYLSRRQLAALRRQRLEHWKISLWHSRCLLGAFSVGSSG